MGWTWVKKRPSKVIYVHGLLWLFKMSLVYFGVDYFSTNKNVKLTLTLIPLLLNKFLTQGKLKTHWLIWTQCWTFLKNDINNDYLMTVDVLSGFLEFVDTIRAPQNVFVLAVLYLWVPRSNPNSHRGSPSFRPFHSCLVSEIKTKSLKTETSNLKI